MALEKCTGCTKDETAEKLYDNGKGECSNCKNYETFKKNNRNKIKFDTVLSNCTSTQSPVLASPNDEPDIK